MKNKKPYKVDTENCTSYFTELEEAKQDFKKWIEFYSNNKGYGNREIKLYENKKILYRYPIEI